MIRKFAMAVFVVVVFSVAGCAHVPKESVQLSEELGGMIRSSQTAHLSLIEGYVNERRVRVDEFMNTKWIPDFLARGVTESGVTEKIEKSPTPAEKGKIMLDFAESATRQIYARRAAQMNALDVIERTMKEEVQGHYSDMVTANQALTAHLRSVAKVTATRDELLRQLKIEPRVLLPVDRINELMDKIVSYDSKLDDLPKYVEDAKKLIRRGN